ncbi:MAG: hypothetical protein C4541_10855 [Candidatus Auribacter fodinae]|uniref:Uncharacterized protein n=1 Tax=Candidatus Auribacter fodinae TaxID=2093366 RepID=A0A3A4QXQ8_9BACT|nr:MAG: hypothetical protein C4541_10855 [Candidatus Auribacter fodinae]
MEWYTIRDAGVTYGSIWNTSEIDDLFGLWSEQSDYIDIDGERWYYFATTYSDREIGEYWVDESGDMHIYLSGELTSASVPEPATLILLMLCIPSLIKKFLRNR